MEKVFCSSSCSTQSSSFQSCKSRSHSIPPCEICVQTNCVQNTLELPAVSDGSFAALFQAPAVAKMVSVDDRSDTESAVAE
jgi:hypothetical protein